MAKQWHQLERLDHRSLKKLQVEREKQVQQQNATAERKKFMIIGASIGFSILLVIVFVFVIKKRNADRAHQEARGELLYSQVSQKTGSTFHRTVGDWEVLTDEHFRFNKEHSFRAGKGGKIAIELQLKNVLKIADESEITVFPPTLEAKENKVNGERAGLLKGEVTVFVGVDGRELLKVEAGGAVAKGASGLFKVLYDPSKETGEIVVKNGLVEVYSETSPDKVIKVSGFYKVVFKRGVLNSPTQASIIQYDWR